MKICDKMRLGEGDGIMASKPIYQIYAELQEYEPKIWRRFQVMNDITVARLAYILMTLFEMQGSHLYLFEVDELNNFIINHLEHYNKYMKDYDNDEFFKVGQYGCIFEDDDIIGKNIMVCFGLGIYGVAILLIFIAYLKIDTVLEIGFPNYDNKCIFPEHGKDMEKP